VFPELPPEPPPEGGVGLLLPPELLAPVPEFRPAQPVKQNAIVRVMISKEPQPEPAIDKEEFQRSRVRERLPEVIPTTTRFEIAGRDGEPRPATLLRDSGFRKGGLV